MLISCSLCDFKYEYLAAFQLHCRIEHCGCSFQCTLTSCNRSFDEWKSFRRHMISKHEVPDKVADKSSEAIDTTSAKFTNFECESFQTEEPESSINVEALTSFIRNDIPEDMVRIIKNEADILVAKLSSKPGLPRSLVTSLIQDFTSFFSSGIIKKLKNFVFTLISNISLPEEEVQKLHDSFDFLTDPFKHVSTEHLRMKYFENLGDYIPPKQYVIEDRLECVVDDGVHPRMKEVTGQFIELTKVLKNFFELPHCLEDALAYRNYLKKSSSDFLSNFMQSEVWKRKVANFSPDSIVFPILPYVDDCEPNNALGPHCEKLCCCYVSLPCLPPEYQSKLENKLFFLLSFLTLTIVKAKKVFRPLIEQLTLLAEKGIEVKRQDGGVVTIFFVTGVFMGDNLGLSSISGFLESFTANYYCRTCKASKEVCKFFLKEDCSYLRTPQNYTEDVVTNNFKVTGVKERCIFEEIPFFETPTDVGVDPFHDLNEGVCHFTMIAIIRHFQSLDSSFLENFNDRMYFFDYGIDSDNKPPSIVPSALEKDKLKMTGGEMLTFVRLFGVFAGDLVEENNEYWRLYTLLHDILSICISKSLPLFVTSVLEVLIKEHNDLYMKLTGHHLKPKHHFLTHYNRRLFTLFGPLALLSTVRMEAKHKQLKTVANVCISRRNLPLTIAIKQQLPLCYRFRCAQTVRPPFLVGPGQVVNLQELEQFSVFSLTLPREIFTNVTQFCPRWVDYLSTKYKCGMFLLTGTDDFRCPEFSRIELVLILNNEPLFVCL